MAPEGGKKKSPSFEDSLDKLDKIVEHLENGSLPIEESLKAFEDGMATYRHCVEILEKARNRIEAIMKRGDEITTRPIPIDNPEAEGE